MPKCPAIVIAICLLLATSRVPAATFHSSEHGYSIEVPDDWDQIPNDEIAKLINNLQGGNADPAIIHDAGFQLRHEGKWFVCPYFLVRVIPYTKFGLATRQVREAEFPEIVKTLSGVEADQIVEVSVPELPELLGQAKTGVPQLDRDQHRYVWPLDMDISGVGRVHSLCVGFFGRQALVQVVFYTEPGKWEDRAGVRDSILSSFKFDPDKAYSAAAAGLPAKRSSRSWVPTAGISSGLVVIIVAIAASRKRKAQRR